MKKQQIINQTVEYVKKTLYGESSGHDWWHIYRVWNMAKHIAKQEKGSDTFVIELAALLHDIADWKFHNGDDTVGPRVAREWLTKIKVDREIIDHICTIIYTMAYKGAKVQTPMLTLEGKIVQDSDRLDAIGAIGIGRTFSYGGNRGLLMYDPNVKPVLHESAQQYIKVVSHTINHFYEKLLLLKDRMNTDTAKQYAVKRHKIMATFLKEFLSEWDGES